MNESKLYRNDVKNGKKTTRYYTVFYDLPYKPNTELYFDIFTETIDFEEDSREVREGGRDDRFINIDESVKDDIYFTEHFKDYTMFSFINQSISKNNIFAWTRCKRLKQTIETEDEDEIKKIQEKVIEILHYSKVIEM
jgi:hypothetical protein